MTQGIGTSYFRTNLGELFLGDCLEVLPNIPASAADMVFADPPFNLGKSYGRSVNDAREESDYIEWCHEWLRECHRILSPGGSLFVYNLPKWNIELGHFIGASLNMQFRHWIAIDTPNSPPIAGRLHPSHYSLLYFSKGKPKTFTKIRTPVAVCRHCGKEIKDYGGYRATLHQEGVSLKDVWTDIAVVRHRKYKSEGRKANALSTKILERAVLLSTVRGDLVLDPFGGSGTTFYVCERLGRRWFGVEIDANAAEDMRQRLTEDLVKPHLNGDRHDLASETSESDTI